LFCTSSRNARIC